MEKKKNKMRARKKHTDARSFDFAYRKSAKDVQSNIFIYVYIYTHLYIYKYIYIFIYIYI